MKFFTTPNSKNIIATLRIVTIEKSELAFLLILYFHGYSQVIRMLFVSHSYVLICHPYVTRMYSYVIRKSLVCTRTSFVCHSYVLVCYSYVTHMPLVCTRMSSVCHLYVVLPWTEMKSIVSKVIIVITIVRFARGKKTPGLIQIAFNKRQCWIHKRLFSFKVVCVTNIQQILLSLFIKLKRVPSFRQ